MLTIVKSPDDQKAIEQNRKRGITENMDYTLLPDKLVITNAPLGKTLDIKSLGRTMKMANSGEKEISLRVKVVPVGSTPLSLQTGYEMAPDNNWLKVKQDIFTIEPASFVDPGLTLTIPKDKIYSKKKYMFVIQVSPADPDIIGVTYYGKLYVEVE